MKESVAWMDVRLRTLLALALAMLAGVFTRWQPIPAALVIGGKGEFLGLLPQEWCVAVIFTLILFAVGCIHENGISIREKVAARPVVLRWVFYLAAVFCVMIFGIYGSDNAAAFIYGQF